MTSLMTTELPIRYAAVISTAGQCRDNLKTWRGAWMFALEGEPPNAEESDGDDEAGPLRRCQAVLSHRSSVGSATECRWYGTARYEYYAGDFACVCVTWEFGADSVPVQTDVAVAPSTLGAEPLEGLQTPGVLKHGFLIRRGYLMLGEVGDAVNSPDNCIRLDVVEHCESIE